jgi:hypothetical protein
VAGIIKAAETGSEITAALARWEEQIRQLQSPDILESPASRMMARGEIVPFHVGLAEEIAHLLDERKPIRQHQPKKVGGPGRSTPRADVLAWARRAHAARRGTVGAAQG